MTNLLCIVGASGSGKTYIAERLEQEGYNNIQSYTTRPQRHSEETGHIFIGKPWLWNQNNIYFYGDLEIKGTEMIAYEKLYGNHYFATDSQVLRGKNNVYVTTPDAITQVINFYRKHNERELKQHYSSEGGSLDLVRVLTIFLSVDEDVRARRLVPRVKDQTQLAYMADLKTIPDIAERLLPDREIFKVVKCDYSVNGNRSKDSVYQTIKEILEQEEM